MAYVDFSAEPILAAHGGGRTARDTATMAPAVAAGLSALEWSVVALARRDRLSSLGTPGRLSMALGAIFGGVRTSPTLADPRLEALRRMAVLSWRRGFLIPTSELKAFLAAGFSIDQYEALMTSIGAARAKREARA